MSKGPLAEALLDRGYSAATAYVAAEAALLVVDSMASDCMSQPREGGEALRALVRIQEIAQGVIGRT